MGSNIITIIPVYNGGQFIGETLQSVANQTVRPDRVIVIDNCSTDNTERVVKDFKAIEVEWLRNPTNIGLFANCNRALGFAPETRHLLLLCADDLIQPRFFEVMVPALESCRGLGLAYCLDERIDEAGKHLSVSGKVDGTLQEIPKDTFLRRKAEIANQAFSATLMKTNFRKAPCQFRLDMAILGDVAFWAEWAQHCDKIIQVNEPLCQYRWHGENTTNLVMPGMQALVLDEWRVMQMTEQLRAQKPGPIRSFKLKGLFAVRTGIKAKRIRQQNNLTYSKQITAEGKRITGPLAWAMGQAVVEARDLVIYGLLRRRRHPRNVYS
jgi:glycosyltransferase involved in cell wall biosynthesis